MQPQDIRSENGVLRATLAAAPSQFRLGEVVFDGFLYNGSYLPPLLRTRVGDTMTVETVDITDVILDKLTLLRMHASQMQPVSAMYRPIRYAYTAAQFTTPPTGKYAERFFRREPL